MSYSDNLVSTLAPVFPGEKRENPYSGRIIHNAKQPLSLWSSNSSDAQGTKTTIDCTTGAFGACRAQLNKGVDPALLKLDFQVIPQ